MERFLLPYDHLYVIIGILIFKAICSISNAISYVDGEIMATDEKAIDKKDSRFYADNWQMHMICKRLCRGLLPPKTDEDMLAG